MNQDIAPLPAAGPFSDPGPGLYSDHMLSELLAGHEAVIGQLRREWLETDVLASFLTGEIDRHEKAAALLRAQSGNRSADTARNGVIILLRKDSSEEEKSLVLRFGPSLRPSFYPGQ
ncbi:MAG TPA: hypothetical protein VK717_00875 [Opitutaceae bacterium]|jgi:hypothetical protein|nr:hypothetical protein [Opitutaceae bacterium]